ncbi:hypothetical protein ACFE04_005025 [Oxalis oulophora]
MKKWSGGLFIGALAVILLISFYYNSSIIQQDQQQQQQHSKPEKHHSAYTFFNNHPKPQMEQGYSQKESTTTPPPNLDFNRTSYATFKKPHVVNFDGLDYLFAPMPNLPNSNVFLVWFQLRTLLSRSDALPETAQGIKEASLAFKDLIDIIDRDKAFKLNNTKTCPSSIYDNKLLMSTHGIVVEVPCGLVQGSSITLLGIPHGKRRRSFQIQLLGFPISGQLKAPVVLHYNVSLPGDNMTEEPFVTQNTWTIDAGWGKEERCPAHGSNSNMKVDELALCNEQIVQTSLEEKQNISHPQSGALANVTQGSPHDSASFPFLEGNPFTATLWAGLEGFHVTVNGRHETSFAYREKLEAWSVNGVKVAGGLDLLSVLAKGLPVTEDHDLVVDAESLKAPPISRKKLVMLVAVFSTGNNFERRMALRRSWMQYEAVRSGDVAVRFIIGLHKNSQVNFELWREAQAYGDIQLMPFVDYYSLISLKTIAICIMATKILPAKFIMKTDDDAFVRIDEVLSNLKEKPSDSLLYGLISYDSAPHRDKDSKWYISNEEWRHETYPPWAHGPGYIISRDIAKFIVQGHNKRNLQLFKLEDVAMGIWIEQFKNTGKEVHYISDDRFYNAGCDTDYILAHYQSPRLVLCLWDKLQREHQAACCE